MNYLDLVMMEIMLILFLALFFAVWYWGIPALKQLIAPDISEKRNHDDRDELDG